MSLKESQIEQKLINKLEELKYTYRSDIRDKVTLERNFRDKFETLNRVRLTDAEFARLRDEIINADAFQAAKTLREYGYFQREDGTPLHYMLVNLKDWCKNDFEVISQLRINTDNSHHRYDVILLINGLPMVQIELKTLGINPRRAMEQIVEYRNEPGNGYANTLLCFMQLFIVSNRDHTWYFANNQSQHFAFNADERFLPIYQWADEDNRKITHLDDFADAFLAKCTLGRMISRYMVLVASEQKLMIMRPYQIYAVKAIVDCIHQNRGNGYIWHTTGSGKTLTSFKASTLLKDNPDIEKCLFVVDRKDLDRQTREEFNRFQEGCVEENTNTETLVRRLLSEDYADKVIVTTIQKLGLALDETSKKAQRHKDKGRQTYKERLAPLRDKRIAIIFDECHRSQFGDNHQAIKGFFPKAQLFGFTGTPIFDDNASYKQIDGTVGSYRTTRDIFEKQLHAYTITHAIDDRNVLRFHIDYYKPETTHAKARPDQALAQRAVVDAILSKHEAATNQRRFNALLATASINDAIAYYRLFKEIQSEMQAQDPDFVPLNLACVFSPPANGDKDVRQLQEDLPQEMADNQQEPEQKKAALQEIIADYNTQYGTSHTVSEFDRYYQDVQQRIKDQQYPNSDLPHKNKIDITIVVDMLLTGFDAKYLNTLYVDKNLKHHGLIQAFSRTNRVLNDTKPYGNILDFRDQEQAVDDAIALFSGEDINRSREIWLVDPAPTVIEKYEQAVAAIEHFLTEKDVVAEPKGVYNLKGDTARIEFVNRFKEVQRLKTQLDQYTDLDEEQKARINSVLPEDDLRSLRGAYLETAQRLKEQQGKTGEQASPDQEAIEQLDFEFVLFSSALIDYDYIMGLAARFSQEKPGKQTVSREQLVNMLSASSNLMEEREDIIDYINTLQAGEGLKEQDIKRGYQAFKAQKAHSEITALAKRHGLDRDALQGFVEGILDRMIFDGEQLSDLFEPLNLGWKTRSQAELALMEELVPFLKKHASGREISGLAAYE
ncbi:MULTISPECIES: type I restriction endonuclease subunit R [Idiomarina]|uniref:type I restriction endonuclease subunit R n=1 Tax=Idiomarina TaxID=135575 RepID=UPI00129CB1AC|nr:MULTISPECIES: type I restriction endonuclease subunit R [Idiomarina]MRJ42232.1 HsdR family type I site-specific deoxyribonuclease [Idiomarina sp. FeN1]NCU57356.1 HsdR family type I site-specific deoxyribonuclease [Idiomarina sp. FenA--70]NCU60543.1 HsdR family type I site-specific deoxyribonuclease [Idiomarina sp. FenBw--71]UUN14725.1 type I restriction endonuclease subunit R [Idiomarina loihiensis]